MIAKVAVSNATYWIDQPYDYLIPEHLVSQVQIGCRVMVPFSRGNRATEALVIGIADQSDYENLKEISLVLDQEPVLSAEMVQLALWMHDRFFCTVYDAVKSMLPTGLWFNKSGKKKATDKYIEYISLSVPGEEALRIAEIKQRKARRQAEVLKTLAPLGQVQLRDLMDFIQVSRATIDCLVKEELVEITKEETFRRPELFQGETQPLPVLNEGQKAVYEEMLPLLSENEGQAALLYGVTGSGKTTVYMHLIHQMLQRSKGVILLVPEIALTPQMIRTFSQYFGDQIAVLHSSLSIGERYDEWKRIRYGQATVVIGTRSAIFAPVKNLGLIVIDEEQEDTYRSENTPRYDAKEIAKYRCVKCGGLLVLGSATPAVESWYAAEKGIYHRYELHGRYNNQKLPEVKIVDMKEELRHGNGRNISRVLEEEIRENINSGEQTILFLNRRGRNRLIQCSECGYVYQCPNCSVSMTYHSDRKRLICHYCGYSSRVDEHCPDCGGILNYVGAGTELIEEELDSLFPGVKTIRMDADSVSRAGGHKLLFEQFRADRIPIMIGTQMVTKGLDFENVTLVGVLSADQSLYVNDYRANEKTFSLLTQVVGRSGRGEREGRAIIQTYTPDNDTIKLAAKQDYKGFYESEIRLRELQQSPPFQELYSITVSGTDESEVIRCCRYIDQVLTKWENERPDLHVLGIAPYHIVMVNRHFRYRVSIRCNGDRDIRQRLASIVIYCSKNKKFKGVSVFAESNPLE